MDVVDLHAESAAQAGELPSATGIGGLVDRVYRNLERFALPCLLILLALVAAVAVVSSNHKPFWYDELFTVIVATRPTWREFYQALPAEGNPPINTLLVRLSIHLFGVSELSVRLPPLLGFLGALTGVYVFVRREAGPVFGLSAVALTFIEPARRYSFEARPYGLLLGFLVLALVSWQSATAAIDEQPRRSRGLALCGMVVGIVGCALSHHIGLLEVAIPLLFGETVRTFRNRRVDWPLVATGLAAVPALAIEIPMIRRTGRVVISHAQILQPPITLKKIGMYAARGRESLNLVLSPRFLALLAILVAVSWLADRSGLFRRRSGLTPGVRRTGGVPAHIYAAVIGTALLIPLTWTAMAFGRGWYFCRYGIGSIVGVSILVCLLLRRPERLNRVIAILLVFALSAALVGSTYGKIHIARDASVSDAVLYDDSSDLPIVISYSLKYIDLWWYAPASVKGRLVFLTSPEISEFMARRDPDTELLDAALIAEREAFHSQIANEGAFLQAQRHFLLDVVERHPGIKEKLVQEGCTATPLRSNNEHQIFDVVCASTNGESLGAARGEMATRGAEMGRMSGR